MCFADKPVTVLNPDLQPAVKQARTSDWLHVSTGYVYRPVGEDEGHRLKVVFVKMKLFGVVSLSFSLNHFSFSLIHSFTTPIL